MPDVPEQRTMTAEVQDMRAEGRTLHGFAAIYSTESRDLGGFTETIEPGAFADVLAADPDVYLTFNHSPDKVLARTRSGTLRLRDEPRGLAFEADLGDGPTAADVRDMVKRGDVSGASFRFVVGKDGERWEGERRTLTRIGRLIDLSLATTPAYDGPRVELRSEPTLAADQRTTQPEPQQEATVPEQNPKQGGGLIVEDRSAETASVEQRVLGAIRGVQPGEVRALTTISASPITPKEISSFVWDLLRPQSVLLASGARVVTTNAERVVWPRITANVDPTWVAEAQVIPAGDPAFGSLEAVPKKLAHRTILSNEVIDDSQPSIIEMLNTHLAQMMALKFDLAAFEGNPSADANSVRGLKYVSGIQTFTAGGANGATLTSYDVFIRATAMLRAANVPPPYAIVAHPNVLLGLELLREASGSNLQLGAPGGLPAFFTTTQLSATETKGTASNASSAFVYAPNEIVVVRRQDATIELDRSRLFDSDQSEMRAKARVDVIVPNPVAVVRIDGILPAA